jgi:hypothetical protein
MFRSFEVFLGTLLTAILHWIQIEPLAVSSTINYLKLIHVPKTSRSCLVKGKSKKDCGSLGYLVQNHLSPLGSDTTDF